MSKLEVDTIAPQSGTQVTLGESGDTITIPAGATFDASSGTLTLADGSVTNAKLANSAITINGSSVSLGGSTTIETGTSWQSNIKTAAFTAVAGEGYWINTTSAAVTMTLPASANVGDTIEFVDYLRTWGTNAVTVNPNSLNYQGNSSPNPVYDTEGQHVRIVYSGATQGWIPTVDDDVSLETPQTYSMDFLVIAGGAAGGSSSNSGGGGAGGYRTSTQTVNAGTTITVTVGDGGASVSGGNLGNSGSNSSISGTGLTTITSAGGGSGGTSSLVGGNGGSGGGGGNDIAGGSGNTPSTTPSQGNDGGDGLQSPPAYGGGGGGGASAVGQNGSGSKGGDGGDGTASSITGSSVTRAGGGAGGSQGSVGTGGAGGGGNGATNSLTPTSGTINTGSGGGGKNSSDSNPSGAGGKGVIILSMPDAKYSGTTTGSPTVATGVSGKTVLTFTGTGSYTA